MADWWNGSPGMMGYVMLVLCLLAPVFTAPRQRQLRIRGQGRVVGGSDADIADYPWQLALMYQGSHICGASIISENYALTAAQCVVGRWVGLITARAGSTYKDSGGVVYNMLAGSTHPSYHPNTLDYDIGSLQVNGSLLGTNMRPVSLPPDYYDPPGGLNVTATGWGLNSTNGSAPNNLMMVALNIVNRTTCQDMFANVSAITDRMVCAADADQSVCVGDSGGPLVSGSMQVGIISWTGGSCEDTGVVYTNVGNLRIWIKRSAGI